MNIKEICPTTTQNVIKSGALIVDIREKFEFDLLRIDVPQILNIPMSEFENRYLEIPTNQDVVLVGNDANKSLLAAGFLVNHGYSKAMNMKHGLKKWIQKGFPYIGDASQVTRSNSCCSSNKCC